MFSKAKVKDFKLGVTEEIVALVRPLTENPAMIEAQKKLGDCRPSSKRLSEKSTQFIPGKKFCRLARKV